MKKYFALILLILAVLSATVCASAAEQTVYLNDGGTGDGSSASAPLGDMAEAISKIADGGKVVITDTYTMRDAFYEPTHKGDIVITGGTFDLNAETFNRYYMAGPGSTTFEHIRLHDASGAAAKGLVVVAQFNELIMGEGVDTMETKTYLIGGYQVPFEEDSIALDLDSHISIKSGNYHVVSGSSRGASTTLFTGTSHIVMDGGTVNMLLGGSCNGSAMGSAEITIHGGTVSQLMMAGDVTRRINGDATVTINGGIVAQLLVNNIMGHATVNYNGGTVAMATKSIESKIMEYVTDGTATLNVNSNLNAGMVALAFDSVNYVGGTLTVTEPEETTAAPDVTIAAKPDDTTAADTTDAVATEESTAYASTDASAEDTTVEDTAEADTSAESTEASDAESTDADKSADTTAPETTVAPVAVVKEGGAKVGLIIGIAAAAVIVIAVVVIVLKKKKK